MDLLRPYPARVGTVVLALLAAPSAWGQPSEGTPGRADVPVVHVSLYTSGVGHFEHSGTVDGDAEIELRVAADGMDDLLGSLLLRDLDGGEVRPVRYPSRDPLGRILSSYALDLSGAPTLAELVAEARGEPVRIEADSVLVGTILGVEREVRAEGGDVVHLVLLSGGGVRRVPLERVRDLRFEREEVREGLAAALDALVRHRDDEEKTVRLRFEGEGTRRVRIGYLREMPVWKASYRVLEGDDGSAHLQGWAIFDNPTDTDLQDVTVTFVAGRPASFVPGLYEPVHANRPRVEVDAGPAIVPPTDAGVLPPSPAPQRSAEADAAMAASRATLLDDARTTDAGVRSIAGATRLGAAFAYRVDEPVTILRHESAMIPIVATDVPALPVSLYDPAVGTAPHPLRALYLTNDSGAHLAAGPVAVYGSGGFSGNATLDDVPPGASRLLAHAVDLGVRVERETHEEPERIARVTLGNGVVEAETRLRVRTLYRIHAEDTSMAEEGRDDLLLIDHPRRSGFELVRPVEEPPRTADGYRFGVRLSNPSGGGTPADPAGVSAAPGELVVHQRCEGSGTCTFAVVEERLESRSLSVANVTPDQIGFFLENAELSDADAEGLRDVLDLKLRISALDGRIDDLQAEIDAIHREGARIRDTMTALDRTSDLYRRYVDELTAQEDELARIRERLDRLREERRSLQEALDERVRSFGGPGADGP